MRRGFFITGTDTDVGKTFVAAALLTKAGQQGLRTSAFKPVAAGAEPTPAGLRNSDALTLLAAMNQNLSYERVNPFCFAPAIAPHIAAAEAGVPLDISTLQSKMALFNQVNADFSLVEGAGGWLVPLNSEQTFADFAVALGWPVILVVAMRLGCINHALLSAQAIAESGLPLAGWVANQVQPEPMARHRQNIDTLRTALPAPLLGELPHFADGDFGQAADKLSLPV
jgi:dethiobiotin synthetase